MSSQEDREMLARISPVSEVIVKRRGRPMIVINNSQPEVTSQLTDSNHAPIIKKKTATNTKTSNDKSKTEKASKPENEGPYDCEYCHKLVQCNVIECDLCEKWGCPSCTVSTTTQKIIMKNNLRWFCKDCETHVSSFCKSFKEKSNSPITLAKIDLTEKCDDKETADRVARLEDIVMKLDSKMDTLINVNQETVRTYADVTQVKETIQQPNTTRSRAQITSDDRNTVKLLDEHADKERRRGNVIIHNIPESEKSTLAERSKEDLDTVNNIITDKLDVEGALIIKTIRLGGRGQNKNNKPRLIMATLESPARRRIVLAAANNLRFMDDLQYRIYINPDLNPKEREEGRKQREDLKNELTKRKENGENDIKIRGNRIVNRKKKPQTTEENSETKENAPQNDNTTTTTKTEESQHDENASINAVENASINAEEKK